MFAIFFSLAVFIFWWLLGTATLSVFSSKLSTIQRILISPSVGIAITILPVFFINRTGIPVNNFAEALLISLSILSLIIIIIKRPILPKHWILRFSAVLIVGLLLVAWPMFQYGFSWTSYSNDDMANYCLGAQRFLNHGYFELPNLTDLFSGRDYAEAYWFMHAGAGMRSGSELMLAFFWGATKLNAHQLFMPIILALNLSLISATGALVASHTLTKKAPLLAMALLAISPLTTLGFLYQLIGQVGGLALLCTAVVLFYRPINNRFWWQHISNNLVSALIFGSLFVWYPEALPFLGLGWFIFLGLKIGQSGANAKFVIVPAVISGVLSLFFIGGYMVTALKVMLHQATTGISYTQLDAVLFPYFLIPSGLPTLFGILPLVSSSHPFIINLAIVVAFFLLIWMLCNIIKQAKEGYPAAVMSMLMVVLGTVLFLRNSDFGLFKLAMIIQPFLAAVVTTAYSRKHTIITKKAWIGLSAVIFAALLSQHQYVAWSTSRSHGGPNEFPLASSKKTNQQFHDVMDSFLNKKSITFFSDTSNVMHAKFQALYSEGATLYFPSRDFFKSIIEFDDFEKISPDVWKHSGGNATAFIKQFKQLFAAQYKEEYLQMRNRHNTWVTQAEKTKTNQETIFISAIDQGTIFNASYKNSNNKNLFYTILKHPNNHLVFVNSELGPHYYYAPDRRKIAFFQLEQDSMFPGQLTSGLGRDLLFRIIGTDPHPRMIIELSTTVLKQINSHLPVPSIYGATRTIVPFVGRGTGRLISEPISPALIDGKQYIDLDMGRDGCKSSKKGPGLMSLYGKNIISDSRRLTSYGRNISLISEQAFQSFTPPSKLERFPFDLANTNLEYSGIYEDGWISEHAFFVLSPQSNSKFFLIKGVIPQLANPSFSSKLQVAIDGKILATRTLHTGAFELKLPISATNKRQRIVLTFENYQRLPYSDDRIVGGKINFIGFVG